MNHAAAWMGWVGGTLIILSTTRNPWYVGLVVMVVGVVRLTRCQIVSEAGQVSLPVWRFGLIMIVFSAVFNALTVHAGRTVLGVIPSTVPFFGGAVTVEALVYGAVNGLILAGLLAVFTTFNQVVSTRQMIRLAPRAFFPVAVIACIAITFVPVTLRHYRDIRTAQAIRGYQLQSWRDWPPLIVPLLVGGLEQALQLAEAMTARGFASVDGPASATAPRLTILVGLLLVLFGWLGRLLGGYPVWGLVGVLAGLVVIGATLWRAGRHLSLTSYRPQLWRAGDWAIVTGAALAGLAFIIPWPGLDRTSIFYYPYPVLSRPEFQPWLALSIAGLLVPVWPVLPPLLTMLRSELFFRAGQKVGKKYDSA